MFEIKGVESCHKEDFKSFYVTRSRIFALILPLIPWYIVGVIIENNSTTSFRGEHSYTSTTIEMTP